jgi:hypothetical protein
VESTKGQALGGCQHFGDVALAPGRPKIRHRKRKTNCPAKEEVVSKQRLESRLRLFRGFCGFVGGWPLVSRKLQLQY